MKCATPDKQAMDALMLLKPACVHKARHPAPWFSFLPCHDGMQTVHWVRNRSSLSTVGAAAMQECLMCVH